MLSADSTESDTITKDIAQVPKLSGPSAEVLDRREHKRDRPALCYIAGDSRERHVSLSYFADQSRRCANLLGGLGVRLGAPVVITLPAIVECYEVVLGCLRAGVTWTSIEPTLTAEDLAERVNAVGAEVLVAGVEQADVVDKVRDQCRTVRHFLCVGGLPREGWTNYRAVVRLQDPDTVETAISAGGPTGTTAAAGARIGGARNQVARALPWKVQSTDLHWPISGVHYAGDLMRDMIRPWEQGACLFMDSVQHEGDPARILGLLRTQPITTMSAPGSVYRSLARLGVESRPFARLRRAAVTHGELDTRTRILWKDRTGIPIHDA